MASSYLVFAFVFVFFRFVSKQICLFRLFRNGSETPKQTETNEKIIFWFRETNRKWTETDCVSVCFGSNRKFFLLFRGHPTHVSRRLYRYRFKFEPEDYWSGILGPLRCTLQYCSTAYCLELIVYRKKCRKNNFVLIYIVIRHEQSYFLCLLHNLQNKTSVFLKNVLVVHFSTGTVSVVWWQIWLVVSLDVGSILQNLAFLVHYC
jgi:hypothetical protein